MEKWRCCLLAQLLLFHTQGMELGLGIVTILTIPRTWFFSDGFLLGSWFQSGTAIPTTSSPLDSCDEPGLVLHTLGLMLLLPVYQPYSWTVPQILIDPMSYIDPDETITSCGADQLTKCSHLIGNEKIISHYEPQWMEGKNRNQMVIT